MGDYKFQNRRDFLKFTLGTAAAVYGLNSHAQSVLQNEKGFTKLTILYTNDQHS
ncbi:MAG: twin-arginine translocation signal domain-containing protein, partial [Bacteroidetes bacterium]|nr:twin-arginine translocation signal domain-containing protein [Bacteroidota bacterium]